MNDFVFSDFLSKIHCHIHHQYDAGFRLNKMESNKLEKNEEYKKYDESVEFDLNDLNNEEDYPSNPMTEFLKLNKY